MLRLAGRDEDAAQELRSALELYEQKGHVVGAEETRQILLELGATAS